MFDVKLNDHRWLISLRFYEGAVLSCSTRQLTSVITCSFSTSLFVLNNMMHFCTLKDVDVWGIQMHASCLQIIQNKTLSMVI